ncbi:hypothetical protein Tco_1018089 [Tanacetum coccineum]|uniref:Uncharacterized protein n=1 Tax=Tanacetum coccineum TaxID=301880 RepID=A0ABQ5FTR7_9ASTR
MSCTSFSLRSLQILSVQIRSERGSLRSTLVPSSHRVLKVVPTSIKTTTSRQELEFLFNLHIQAEDNRVNNTKSNIKKSKKKLSTCLLNQTVTGCGKAFNCDTVRTSSEGVSSMFLSGYCYLNLMSAIKKARPGSRPHFGKGGAAIYAGEPRLLGYIDMELRLVLCCEKGHYTNDCIQLKRQLEIASESGKLNHLVKDVLTERKGNQRGEAPQAAKVINMIRASIIGRCNQRTDNRRGESRGLLGQTSLRGRGSLSRSYVRALFRESQPYDQGKAKRDSNESGRC